MLAALLLPPPPPGLAAQKSRNQRSPRAPRSSSPIPSRCSPRYLRRPQLRLLLPGRSRHRCCCGPSLQRKSASGSLAVSAPHASPSHSLGPQVFPRVTPRGDPARRGEDRLQGGEGRLASPQPPPTALPACRLDGAAPALAHGLRNCIPRPPAPSKRNNPILTEAHGTLVPPRHPVGKIRQFAQFLPLPKWPSLGQQQGQSWSPHSHSLLIDVESEK